MCTLTWQFLPGGYELHFNRDERRSRAQAEPPTISCSSNMRSIAPKDPEAGGTWVSVNQAGLSVCLLNNYKEIKELKGVRSRGLLVKELGGSSNLQDAKHIFQSIEVTSFSPFDLFLFYPDEPPTRYRWDGETNEELHPQESFMSSSGFDTDSVIHARKEQYVENGMKNLSAFHRSHSPSRSAYSVCMHRPDARTQSYSRIRVNDESCEFWYTDGPPCSETLQGPISVLRNWS